MKILVIKPSSLGDVIHTLPFLKAIKDSFPQSQVDWVISKNLKEILDDNPLINKLIPIDKDLWKRINKLPQTLLEISSLKKTLQSKHYDIVVDLQGLLRSGLITLFAPTDLKIGFADSREGSSFFYNKKIPINEASHAVDKCLEVAKAIGARVDNVEFPLYINSAAKDHIKELMGDIKEYIVIVPSARWITKRWPAEYFASLIAKLKVPCAISGNKGDREILQKTTNLPQGKIIDLCGKTDLKELIALLAGAKVVVTNDTGPMHIAAALGKPVIAIFGPTDPEKTGPYGWKTNKKLKVLRADVQCSPCRKKKCKELICMNNIRVKEVFDSLKEYL